MSGHSTVFTESPLRGKRNRKRQQSLLKYTKVKPEKKHWKSNIKSKTNSCLDNEREEGFDKEGLYREESQGEELRTKTLNADSIWFSWYFSLGLQLLSTGWARQIMASSEYSGKVGRGPNSKSAPDYDSGWQIYNKQMSSHFVSLSARQWIDTK